MKSLRILQQDFQNYILLGDQPILHNVISTKKVNAEQRLSIYTDAYRLRLVEVLESSYPTIKMLLGSEQAFQEMGFAYIETFPSSYFNVRWYGNHLAQFLETTEPYRNQPYLAETAAFEWAMTLTFDAADEPIASIDHVAAIPPDAWPEMHCIPQQAVQRLDLYWNIPEIWNAVDAGKAFPPPSKSDSPTAWLLWRQALKIYFRSLQFDETWALDAMIKGANFGEICEGLCEWIEPDQVALYAAGLLKRWLADGIIRQINLFV